MTDPIVAAFDQLEREMRDYRKRIPARPLFRSETPKGGRPKGTSDRSTARQRHRKKAIARYAECVAAGICTVCRRAKSDSGRLCTGCREKEHKRWKKKSAGLSERRAKRRGEA